MEAKSATAEAGANIAFTKYWGNVDTRLRIPANDSISMTLDAARTLTTVSFRPDLEEDYVVVDGCAASGSVRQRVVGHLDLFRQLADTGWRAKVVSGNNFPTASGIASSASAFAALTVACAEALELDLTRRDLSRLARRGSGSAARSMFGGFAILYSGASDEGAFAEPLHDPDWWEICDLVAVVSRSGKDVSSTGGHRLAQTSPLHRARLAQVPALNKRLREALAERDFDALGRVAEQDALLMHAVMLTSCPALLYWLPETVTVMRRVRRWRAEGIPAYFTIDAGPNVHILTPPEHVNQLLKDLQANPAVQEVLVCQPGPGAQRVKGETDERCGS